MKESFIPENVEWIINEDGTRDCRIMRKNGSVILLKDCKEVFLNNEIAPSVTQYVGLDINFEIL